jgi:mycofactocin precursor
MDTTAPLAVDTTQAQNASHESVSSATTTPHIVEELLVEEISIDGMCGVY